MLADAYDQESESRKDISVNLKKDLLAILSDLNADGWLFGKKLGERVKVARAIERSGQELKKVSSPLKQRPSQFQRNPLNVKGPSRPQSSSNHLGGQRYRGNSKTPHYSRSQIQNRREFRGHLQKRRGERLLILNLKSFNRFVTTEHFKLEDRRTVCRLISHKRFMAMIDIKDAY
nr:unnamed protein product [Callosobruchus chinensis]